MYDEKLRKCRISRLSKTVPSLALDEDQGTRVQASLTILYLRRNQYVSV